MYRQVVNDRQQSSEEKIERLSSQLESLVTIGRKDGWITQAAESDSKPLGIDPPPAAVLQNESAKNPTKEASESTQKVW